MIPTLVCLHCALEIQRNPRIKNGQKYCNARECQNARILSWKREKYAASIEYRKKCQKWQKDLGKRQPAYQYQREYRAKNPDYVVRNRELQRKRDKNYRKTYRVDYLKNLVNSNAFIGNLRSGGIYVFIPGKWQKIVNSNALNVTVQLQR